MHRREGRRVDVGGVEWSLASLKERVTTVVRRKHTLKKERGGKGCSSKKGAGGED